MRAKKAVEIESQDQILTGEIFDRMTAEQRANVIAEIEGQNPQERLARSRPMNAAEMQKWKSVKSRWTSKSKIGKDATQIVSVAVRKKLLKQADAYAKANGIKRSELFSLSIAEKIGATTK